jgi:DNA (cytosine-5)-methyltransferase 1
LGAKTGLYKVHSTQTRNPNRPSLTRECDCGSKKLYQKCCGAGGGSGHLAKDDGTTYCLDSGNTQAVEIESSTIRRLTPRECERLQGFPDDWTEGESDTQRYKMMGNAVSVPVVSAVVERLYEIRTK